MTPIHHETWDWWKGYRVSVQETLKDHPTADDAIVGGAASITKSIFGQIGPSTIIIGAAAYFLLKRRK